MSKGGGVVGLSKKGKGDHTSFRLGQARRVLEILAEKWDCSLTTALKRVVMEEGERLGIGNGGGGE